MTAVNADMALRAAELLIKWAEEVGEAPPPTLVDAHEYCDANAALVYALEHHAPALRGTLDEYRALADLVDDQLRRWAAEAHESEVALLDCVTCPSCRSVVALASLDIHDRRCDICFSVLP